MAEPLYAFRREPARYLKGLVRRKTTGGVGGKAHLLNSKGEGSGRLYRLLEDFIGDGPAWADWVTRSSNVSRGVFQVHCFDGILDGAPAGYKGTCIKIDGDWVPPVNPCIEACESAGSITAGTAPQGTVGEVYAGHTVASSGVTGLAITALPPGLTDAGVGEISGTPTTTGTFYAIVTGTAPKTVGEGDCTITRVIPITIVAAEEE